MLHVIFYKRADRQAEHDYRISRRQEPTARRYKMTEKDCF